MSLLFPDCRVGAWTDSLKVPPSSCGSLYLQDGEDEKPSRTGQDPSPGVVFVQTLKTTAGEYGGGVEENEMTLTFCFPRSLQGSRPAPQDWI